MTYNFGQHISTLLKNYECVVIPNFGAFILQPESASISGNKLFPPHKDIAFNKGLTKDDGLLTGALMSEGLLYKEAQVEVFKFANQLKYQLKKEQKTSIVGLGNFFISDRGLLKFKATTTANFDKSSFGFQPILLHKVHRDIISTPSKIAVPAPILEKRTTKKRSLRKAPLLALCAVFGLIAYVSFLWMSNSGQNNFVQEAGFFATPSADTFEMETSLKEISKTQLTSSNINQRFDDEVAVHIIQTNTADAPKGYFVVMGSYSSQENASRKESELFETGEDTYILPSGNGYFRVCIKLNHNENLLQSFQSFQSQQQDCWILENV